VHDGGDDPRKQTQIQIDLDFVEKSYMESLPKKYRDPK
jgi:hypothetical protein